MDNEKLDKENIVYVKDLTGNPAALGLLGFGLTTILLNMHNAGFYPLNSMILAMGIFYGGIAQVIAGIMEWKKKSTFGATAFISFGMFWLTFVGLVVFPKFGWGEPTSAKAMSAFLFVWGLFALVMFIATLKMHMALQVVFGTAALLFFLLAIADLTGSESLKMFAGYEGILCGLSAMYTGLAHVLNETYEKTILPIGK